MSRLRSSRGRDQSRSRWLDEDAYVKDSDTSPRDEQRSPQPHLTDQFRGNAEWKDEQPDELEGAAEAVASHLGWVLVAQREWEPEAIMA